MNKRLILMYVVVSALLVIFTHNALAYTVTAVGGSGFGPYQTGSGGEFTWQVSDDLQWVLNYYSSISKVGSITNSFQSFCIEGNETISSWTSYSAKINDAAIMGGNNKPTSGKDPISIGTAWLYSQFATGKWEAGLTYNYNNANRKQSAEALQNAIWWLEGEVTLDNDQKNNNIFVKAVLTKYLSEVGAMADSNGAFGVRALNLTQNGINKQDQLVMTPIPAAVWLFGSGLLGFVGVRRRFFLRKE